jgi:hypothetical protein
VQSIGAQLNCSSLFTPLRCSNVLSKANFGRAVAFPHLPFISASAIGSVRVVNLSYNNFTAQDIAEISPAFQRMMVGCACTFLTPG